MKMSVDFAKKTIELHGECSIEELVQNLYKLAPTEEESKEWKVIHRIKIKINNEDPFGDEIKKVMEQMKNAPLERYIKPDKPIYETDRITLENH